jgi:hypothetical protein
MCINDRTDQIQLASAEALILSELRGLNPELACPALPADMNVRRFIAFNAVEIEALNLTDASDRVGRP